MAGGTRLRLSTRRSRAVAYAKSSGKADTAKLAVTGFCWGGWATWMYSARNPDLKAAVAWHGSDRKPSELTPKNPLDIAADVKCPVLALHGGAVQSIPQETIEKRQAACKAAGKTCEFAVYRNAPKGFNADYRPSYRADAAKGRPDENAGLVQASRGRIGAGAHRGCLWA
jgi:carboxymethylenebutenolidase